MRNAAFGYLLGNVRTFLHHKINVLIEVRPIPWIYCGYEVIQSVHNNPQTSTCSTEFTPIINCLL